MSTIEKIKKIAEKCNGLIDEYKGEIKLQHDYKSIIDERIINILDCDKPRLMVCGVYSAGKSTIVNVLCRKEVAEVGAQPKTDRVTEYKVENKDYVLIDSPGVDAPIEHERITDDNIKKCNAIMFVVSTKNAESESNYRKINEWMEYEKPLIIVINEKDGNSLVSKDIKVIREKIEENLRRSGYDKNKKYDVIAVNAKMGAIGINVEDEVKRNGLLAESNILQLESLINSKMKDGYNLYLGPIGELQRVLDSIEKELAGLETGNNNKELLFQLSLIENEGKRISDSIRRQIRKMCDDGKKTLVDVCVNNAGSSEDIENTSKNVVTNIVKRIDDEYKSQVGKLAGVVNSNFEKYDIHMDDNGSIKIGDKKFKFEDMGFESTGEFAQKDAIAGMMGGAVLGEMIGTAVGAIATGAATTAGSAIALSLAAGTGGGVAGGLAGLPLGPIGVIGGAVLGLFVGGWSAKRKKEEAEAKNQQVINEENRRRQAAMDAYYKKVQTEVSVHMDEAENAYAQKSSEMISMTISNLADTINMKINENNKYNERIAQVRKEVATLKAELEGLKNCLQ